MHDRPRPASLASSLRLLPLLPLQLALGLRSAGRAGQPPLASPGVNLNFFPDEYVKLHWPEDPKKVSVARGLGAEFERTFGQRVDEAIEGIGAPILLTVSGNYERLFVNFLLNLHTAASTTNVVNAMLDPLSLSTCRLMAKHSRIQPMNVTCIDLIGMIPNEAGGQPHPKSYLWAKVVVLHRAVRASSYGVLMADVDVIFYKDLLNWVTRDWEINRRIVLTVGTEWDTCCNTGTVYARRDRSMPLLDLWLEANHRWYHRRLGDQDALLELMEYNVSTQLDIANNFKEPFPSYLIDNQTPHKFRITLFTPTMVIEQGHKCRGCPCRGPCSKGEGPYAKHYNCISMHMQQEHTLRSRGNWSEGVDDFSQTRSKGRMEMMMADGGDWSDSEVFRETAEGRSATSQAAHGGSLARGAHDGVHR